jgi:hypothetical protein
LEESSSFPGSKLVTSPGLGDSEKGRERAP